MAKKKTSKQPKKTPPPETTDPADPEGALSMAYAAIQRLEQVGINLEKAEVVLSKRYHTIKTHRNQLVTEGRDSILVRQVESQIEDLGEALGLVRAARNKL